MRLPTRKRKSSMICTKFIKMCIERARKNRRLEGAPSSSVPGLLKSNPHFDKLCKNHQFFMFSTAKASELPEPEMRSEELLRAPSRESLRWRLEAFGGEDVFSLSLPHETDIMSF